MPDPECAVYLRTYQPSEAPRHKAWRRNVIALWNELHAMAPCGSNAILRSTLEYLGNRGPRRNDHAEQE